MLLRAATLEEMTENPVGCWVAGNTFAHFCTAPALWGVLLWGRPNEEDAIQLGRSLVLELKAPAEPHASIVDASRLVGGDVGAFAMLERYMVRHSERLAQQVTRLALVRPSGLEGALVAGAYEVLPRPYAVSVFGTMDTALDWLGVGVEARADTALAIDRMYESISGTPALIGSLRSWLDRHLAGPTIADAATALALSERSLQRKLQEHDVTFQEEVGLARVRAAQRLLEGGDTPLTTIALEVGCASPQHFSALFRRVTGESPSAWRARSKSKLK